jgi:hypothetical protein
VGSVRQSQWLTGRGPEAKTQSNKRKALVAGIVTLRHTIRSFKALNLKFQKFIARFANIIARMVIAESTSPTCRSDDQ